MSRYETLFKKYINSALSMDEEKEWRRIIMQDIKMQERCKHDVAVWNENKINEIAEYRKTITRKKE